jgi:hypothetical protein
MKNFCVSFILLLIIFYSSFSQIPQTLSYQGVLTDGNGEVVSGDQILTFKLYDVDVGGAALWQEIMVVAVDFGVFNVILGSVENPLDLPFNTTYWLGITVGSGTELQPRIELTASAYSLNSRTVEDSSITSAKIADLTVVRSINTLKDEVNIAAGENISIESMDHTITISASGGGGEGDITAVNAGDGLTGGGETGIVTVDVEAGIGINVLPDAVSMDTIFTDERYINEGQENSITGNMIIDGQVFLEDISEGAVGSMQVINNSLTADDLAENSVGTIEVSNNSLLAEDLGVNVISSIDGIIHHGGDIDLVAGDNVTITPDEENHRIMISAAGGTAVDFIKKDTPDTSRGTSSIPMLSITNLGDGESINGYSVVGDGISGRSENNFGTVGWTAGSNDKSGVFGFSSTGRGVTGRSDNNDGTVGWTGVSDKSGVYGHSTDGFGVTGVSENSYGVRGFGRTAVYAEGSQYGIVSKAVGPVHGFGVWAEGDSSAVTGLSNEGLGISGSGEIAVVGHSGNASGWLGDGRWHDAAVVGYHYSGGYSGYFTDKVYVGGLLEKAGGGFKIDHPLDPANKYLNHSFVESPDMKNVYDGVVILNNDGEAIVELPEWFQTLNSDFRYQLTCIGGFAPVYISEEISNNQFRISGGSSDLKVSWQVTGIRQDAWAQENRILVEQEKQNKEKGKYMHPKALGVSETLDINYITRKRMMEKKNKMEALIR